MIKVCHIITKLELGGAQQNTLHTVQHLNQTRFLPLLITGTEGFLVEHARRMAHVEAYFIPQFVREIRPFQDLCALYGIWKILRRERANAPELPFIVHTHSSKAGILGRWAAKLAGVRCIIHSIHGFSFHAHQRALLRWFYIIMEWLTAKITTHFIAVSAANITTGKALGFFSASQVSLIRSGIDIRQFQAPPLLEGETLSQFRVRMLHALQIAAEKKVVALIACFKPQKAPLDFVRAMKRVVQQVPEAHAVMVGDGMLRPQIEALIAQEELGSAISLLGWRTDIPAILHLCEVLVLTSRWEGLPRVCPQAMAAGKPIVATNVDGIPEAVHDGVNGFLTTPGDVEATAKHIISLLQDSEAARQMGQEGRRLVEEFDIDVMVQQQEDLYQELITT